MYDHVMMQYKDKMCCTNTILYKIDKYVGQIMITAGRIEFPNHHAVTCDTTKKQTSSSHKSLKTFIFLNLLQKNDGNKQHTKN